MNSHEGACEFHLPSISDWANSKMRRIRDHSYHWVLTEPVYLTIVGSTSVLVTRAHGAGAFVLEVTEDGEVMLNGRITEDYEEDWLHLVDLILVNSTAEMIGRQLNAYWPADKP